MRLALEGTWTVGLSARVFGKPLEIGPWTGRIRESLVLVAQARIRTGPWQWVLREEDGAVAVEARLGGSTLWRGRWRPSRGEWPVRVASRWASLDAVLRLTEPGEAV
ncbi:MAG: hypothetical protein N2109_04125 [Fimbriimonadales bacterium]|nr:hypothetical protein [Fimbriimonadales bacterium]